MLVTITNEQKVKLTLAPKTDAQNPATVENAVWEVTSGDATLEVAEDGLSAYAISGEANVNSVITVTADKIIGEGVENLTDTVDLAVVAAAASSLGLVIGTAELK